MKALVLDRIAHSQKFFFVMQIWFSDGRSALLLRAAYTYGRQNLDGTKPFFLQWVLRYIELKARECLKWKLFLCKIRNNEKYSKMVHFCIMICNDHFPKYVWFHEKFKLLTVFSWNCYIENYSKSDIPDIFGKMNDVIFWI